MCKECNGIPPEMCDRAKKDFGFYRGLCIKVGVINTLVGGMKICDDIEVKIVGFSFMEFDNNFYDSFWDVEITPQGLKDLSAQVPGMAGYNNSALSPYILGFTYEVDENNNLIGAYRGWL